MSSNVLFCPASLPSLFLLKINSPPHPTPPLTKRIQVYSHRTGMIQTDDKFFPFTVQEREHDFRNSIYLSLLGTLHLLGEWCWGSCSIEVLGTSLPQFGEESKGSQLSSWVRGHAAVPARSTQPRARRLQPTHCLPCSKV